MKIKSKLMISFLIIILVPVLLSCAVLAGFHNFQIKAINESYGITDSEEMWLTNSVLLLKKVTEQDYAKYAKLAADDPDKLLDEKYLEKENEALSEKYSYLIVKNGANIIFNGGDDNRDVLLTLPKISNVQSGSEVSSFMDSDDKVIIKQLNFTDMQKNQDALYIVTSTQSVVPEVKHFMIELVIAILIILVVTAVMLIVWIYGSLLNPIKKLQFAAENIKEGNLDFSLETSSSDGELGELCVTFEQMRQRLKSNAEEKITNETENRTLISNIAHDLKTPITAVKGYSEGILDGVANTPEKIDKYVRTIYNKASEMDTLINELTLYSKIDTNRIPYNFAKINVAEYFSDCVEEIGLDLEAKNIELSYSNYVDKKTLIIADPEQIRRVINNIIGNSVKYMDKTNGSINIRINDVGDFIQVEIEDNGRGIAQKDLPYIFDRFYRADASRNSATGGSGIGLSIVKKIVEDHGGKIWATSKEGSGTKMVFVIRKYQEVPNE